MNIQSVLVEGGAKLLQSFIDEKLYDEIIVITNPVLFIGQGLDAPERKDAKLLRSLNLLNDRIKFFL